MVVVNETKRGQLLALLEQCAHLNADVRPRTDKGYFTVTVPPPWNGPAKQKAQEMQNRIKKWSKQYPNVICYCFDSFSTFHQAPVGWFLLSCQATKIPPVVSFVRYFV